MSRAVPASGTFLMHSSTSPLMHSSTSPLMHGHDGVGGGRALESYGFGGFPGNAVLAAGLYETRLASLIGKRPAGATWTGSPPWGNPPATNTLPVMDHVAGVGRLGGKPRSAVAVFELISSVAFSTPGPDTALLSVAGQPLARITRPARRYFEEQLDIIDAEASLRDRRYTEVLTQVAPPLAYYGSIVNLQAERHGKTMLLLNMALDFAYAVTARFKHALACPRPSEYSSVIQPMIEVPMHPAFPAGHAVEGHVLATLLSALSAQSGLAGLTAHHLRRAAARIAHNRVIAGLHFPIDTVAGRVLGDALAGYLLACFGAKPNWQGGEFDGSTLALGNPASGALAADQPPFADINCAPIGQAQNQQAIPFLQQMWVDATSEW